eukprot:TRINITY_DN17239_c0_g3_i1.p1 TRINITY_DN17239_c0_g3~~TRINITY_DN17239_c0_g3_i1.p1  ORF type:complete len:332 (-),score=46.25 TRINITY_DN17239_c0_g3_i1:492-1487(-)
MKGRIRGKPGFRRRSEQRQDALEIVWTATSSLVEAEKNKFESDPVSSLPTPLHLNWKEVPEGLDPAQGELDEERAGRKRAQVASLAMYAIRMMTPNCRVVEFGAGSGHLGILIAYQRPDVQVVMVETKDYSIPVAQQRVDSLGLKNCKVFHGTVDEYAATADRFDLAVGLHTCGLLADAILGLVVRRGAAACIVPCCYGQVATLKEDHLRGEGTSQRMHPCSTTVINALGDRGLESFPWCAKSADFVGGRGGAFDDTSEGFQTALRCMQTVDTDRIWWARERGYEGFLRVLSPLNCSPKCSVVCIYKGENRSSFSSWLQCCCSARSAPEIR